MHRSIWRMIAFLVVAMIITTVAGLRAFKNREHRAYPRLAVHPHRRSPANVDEPIPKTDIEKGKLSSRAVIGTAAKRTYTIPKGTRLFAVVDNDCVSRKASAGSLSLYAVAKAQRSLLPGMKTQAFAFDTEDETALDSLAAAAEADDCVLQVSDERQVHLHAALTNDPLIVNQAHIGSLNTAAAWNTFYNSGFPITKDVVVAVIDSGVDLNHEDLTANFWHDANGNVGYNFIANNATPTDDLNHGTHVAGLIAAAANNGKGGTGLTNGHVKLMAIKVINSSDSGSLSDLINGIRWAVDHGADVINLSLGGSDTNNAERAAVDYAVGSGVVVVAAAGNDAKELTASANDYPAAFSADTPGVISVGAVDTATGKLCTFSNFSSTYVSLVAPGAEDSSGDTGLMSTFPGNTYARMAGTSMATPTVSAAVALTVGWMKSAGQTLSAGDIADLVINSARPDPQLTSDFKSGGVLDLERLSRMAKWRMIIDSDAGTGDPQ